jgi:hypothetical protein
MSQKEYSIYVHGQKKKNIFQVQDLNVHIIIYISFYFLSIFFVFFSVIHNSYTMKEIRVFIRQSHLVIINWTIIVVWDTFSSYF